MKACHRAKVPLGSSKVAAAWERAKQNLLPLPPKVMAIQKPDFQLLCAFFREMQAGAGDGNEWFVVTTIVKDPAYLRAPFVTSSHFRREPDGSKWHPSPCKT